MTKDRVGRNQAGSVVTESESWRLYRTLSVSSQHGAWDDQDMFADHPGGVNLLMADNSVHHVSSDAELFVLLAMASKDGREGVDMSFLKD